MAGDPDKAREALESNCRDLERIGDRAYLATRRVMRADVLYRLGRYEDAFEQVRASAFGSTADDVLTEWLRHSVEARLAARAGDRELADELIDAASRMLSCTDAVVLQATCELDSAEVLSLTGRAAEAVAATERALWLFDEKGDRVDADRARAVRSRLR
jgi:ATP/maltotriose-dependent transcriptional regulator MalT